MTTPTRPSALALAVLAAGCASAPMAHRVVPEETFQASYTEAWDATVDALAELNMPFRAIDKESGLITTDWLWVDDSMCDCGSAGLGAIGNRQARFNVYVRRVGDNEVRVRVSGLFQARRYDLDGDSRGPIQCTSRGTLERGMRSQIRARIRAE